MKKCKGFFRATNSKCQLVKCILHEQNFVSVLFAALNRMQVRLGQCGIFNFVATCADQHSQARDLSILSLKPCSRVPRRIDEPPPSNQEAEMKQWMRRSSLQLPSQLLPWKLFFMVVETLARCAELHVWMEGELSWLLAYP